MPDSSVLEPSPSGRLFRVRPHWFALAYYYGVWLVVSAQFIEDLALGHARIYSGEFFPWQQYVDWTKILGPHAYWLFAGTEALLLCAYALRVRVSATAASLAVIVFLDNLGSYNNHRLLMAIQLLLVSLVPVPPRGSGRLLDKKQYWNLDLARWQLSIVYLMSAVHKLNPQFLSGRTLSNLFFMLQEQGMHRYSDAVFEKLQDPLFCLLLAWLTVLTEGALAVGLNVPAWVGRFVPLSIALHVGMASLLPYIWVFSIQMILALIAFLPDRTPSAPLRFVHDAQQRPPRLLGLLVPGAVTLEVADPSSPRRGWWLLMPDGEEQRGFDAWLALLSLSPLTFLAAETLRSVRKAAG
ncbi:MAG: HTTM domain-containing protein [Deltaproteobacteria bacterium]